MIIILKVPLMNAFNTGHGMPSGDSPSSNNKVGQASGLCDNTSYLERFKASHLHWRQRIVRGRIWNGVDLDTVLKPPPLIRQLYFCSRRGEGE